MQLFIGLIRNLLRAFFRNIGKIFFVLFLSILFIFFLFPLNELSDLASQNISKLTQNQFHVEFETLKLNLFSDFGFQIETELRMIASISKSDIRNLKSIPSLSLPLDVRNLTSLIDSFRLAKTEPLIEADGRCVLSRHF